MRRALEYAKMFGLTVMDHCQDYSLVGKGVMHEGYRSTVLGFGWMACRRGGIDCAAKRDFGRAHGTPFIASI